MRTSTNFFLFSLAVADIAILLMGETTIILSSQRQPQKCHKKEDNSPLSALEIGETIEGRKKDDGVKP